MKISFEICCLNPATDGDILLHITSTYFEEFMAYEQFVFQWIFVMFQK